VREETEKYKKYKKYSVIFISTSIVFSIKKSHSRGCNSQRKERERERRGEERRRKNRVLFLEGSWCLIRCFSLYFFWCDNLRCLILIGGHKGAGYTSSLYKLFS
jgi:hypothetical protein